MVSELIQTMLKQVLEIKKVFNNQEKLVNDISNNKVKKEGAVKRMKKSISDSEQLRQNESTAFQNSMIYVLYYLFNSFGLHEKPLQLNEKKADQLKLPKYVGVSKERYNEIMNTIIKAKNDGLKTSVDERKITLDNAESLLKDIVSGKINGGKY